MSFMLFPPEINSWMINTGPGAGPLLEAAAAWTAMAADLSSSATATHGVASDLPFVWNSPASLVAESSIATHITSLQQAASAAAEMAQQATTAAALFQSAQAASVPPAVIAANRATLLSLIATNWLGQNTPAIMATEHMYEVMWAQDGATMDTYDGASKTNNKALAQPATAKSQAGSAADGGQTGTQPSPTTPQTPGGSTGAPQATIGQTLSMLGVPDSTIQALPESFTSANLQTASQFLYYPATYGSTAIRYLMMLQQFARMGSAAGSSLASQTSGAASGGTGTLMTQIGDFVNDKLQGAVGVLAGHFSSATSAISAKLGEAASMGALKVPGAWAAAADGMVRAAPVLPATTVSAPVQTMSATSGLPGGPFGHAMMGAMAGRGMGAIAAKAPKVIPRSPAGG
ncbi:PPE family protein [Mycobacterium sp. M1]|uniref:PPE family protein n=1 Tax=Mycolicibacter acidiphilus TaxID=2835306 RepID=A0ABS5RCY3_9MYCO|nr:PPE family protein [Mycolicibacter acidiphilus]MBS9532142.1 PPE family protein [Mycolicibacter acidiphilus]